MSGLGIHAIAIFAGVCVALIGEFLGVPYALATLTTLVMISLWRIEDEQ